MSKSLSTGLLVYYINHVQSTRRCNPREYNIIELKLINYFTQAVFEVIFEDTEKFFGQIDSEVEGTTETSEVLAQRHGVTSQNARMFKQFTNQFFLGFHRSKFQSMFCLLTCDAMQYGRQAATWHYRIRF